MTLLGIHKKTSNNPSDIVAGIGDESGRLIVRTDTGVPIQVAPTPGAPLTISTDLVADISDAGNTVAVTSTAGLYRLPQPGGIYLVMAHGASVYLLSGNGSQTATATAGSGYGLLVETGQVVTVRLAGPTVSYICHADDIQTGVVTFLQLKG
jgi:hypothetical protein